MQYCVLFIYPILPMSQIFLVATTTSIESLHAKTTSIESFKSGSEENKKQRSSVLSYRLRIQPLKLVLLEFQVENGILLIAVVRVWVIYRLYQRLEPRNLHESRKTWSDGFPGTALPIAAEISYLAKKTTLNSPELKFLNVKP